MPSYGGYSQGSVNLDAVAHRVEEVRAKIEEACRRAHRSPGEVLLVAVTKGRSLEQVEAALAAGLQDLGENYVQEGRRKAMAVGTGRCRWHFIGHLQTNKVRQALEYVDRIHSLDGFRLAEELNDRALRAGRRVPCLVEVNVSGEASKHGVSPVELPALYEHAASLPGIELEGLMTMAPLAGDGEASRPVFARLRQLADDLTRRGLPARELSMGMTQDFEVAIEEGATMVRVGTALFGPLAA